MPPWNQFCALVSSGITDPVDLLVSEMRGLKRYESGGRIIFHTARDHSTSPDEFAKTMLCAACGEIVDRCDSTNLPGTQHGFADDDFWFIDGRLLSRRLELAEDRRVR